MAIVNLGTRLLAVGDAPARFTMFRYNQRRAYGIRGIQTLSDENTIFSRLRMTPIITNNAYGTFALRPSLNLAIAPGRFMFFLPFSRLVGANGQVVIQLERISTWTGGGVKESNLDVQLAYDNNDDIRSWLD